MFRWHRNACAGVLLLACLAASADEAVVPARPGLLEPVVAYATSHYDKTTGLITDKYGRPDVVGSSIGFVAVALAGSEKNRQLARDVLSAILSNQDTTEHSATCGHFKWLGGPKADYQSSATLYVVPLLAYIHVTYGSAVLGSDLDGKVIAALQLGKTALQRDERRGEDGTTYLLRAAALAAAGRALDDTGLVSRAVELAAKWGRRVRAHGMPEGHSPTYDALKVAALRWVCWAGPARAGLEDAYKLLWFDFVQRADKNTGCLAGAIRTAFGDDYLTGASVASYLIYFDLGGPRPAVIEPFAAYLLVPPPLGIVVSPPSMPLTVTTACDEPDAVTRTDTFVCPDFTLGTLSGHVNDDAILALVTYSLGGDQPTSYFFMRGGPASVSSIQHENTAIVSVDFDNLGGRGRQQAWVDGIIGTRYNIERVLLFGTDWPGFDVAVGEMSVLAVQTRNCYLAVRPLHCGPAVGRQVREGPKAAMLGWIGSGPTSQLRLRIYAHHPASPQPARPLDNVRATFMVRVEPRGAFQSLEEFSRAVTRTRVLQTVKRQKKRLRDQEDARKPPMLTEWKPKSKAEMVYQHFLFHTINYTSPDLSMVLTEDMIANQPVSRTVNGQPADAQGPLVSPLLTIKWPPGKGTGARQQPGR